MTVPIITILLKLTHCKTVIKFQCDQIWQNVTTLAKFWKPLAIK